MDALDQIVALSHTFGTPDYVKGGGGNTSCKTADMLWVKPSGTTLAGLTADAFVKMDRARIRDLYEAETPADPSARETLVKDLMAAATLNDAGRASVEAPLHNAFDATYVVHTHPVLVNGMTCANDGEAVCRRLFPDALWVEYIDPGYTLCMEVRERLVAFREEHGHEPQLLVLENHGIFVAADTPDAIRELYARVMSALRAEYEAAGIATELDVPEGAASADACTELNAAIGDEASCFSASGPFAVADGPITPDHLVYSRAYPLTGDISGDSVAGYQDQHGFPPKVVVTVGAVYGLGNSQKRADLALEFAQDGALVAQLAEAFGGVQFMTDAQREFIENWEVEAYRAKQM